MKSFVLHLYFSLAAPIPTYELYYTAAKSSRCKAKYVHCLPKLQTMDFSPYTYSSCKSEYYHFEDREDLPKPHCEQWIFL